MKHNLENRYCIETSCLLWGKVDTEEDRNKINKTKEVAKNNQFKIASYCLEGTLEEILKKQSYNTLAVFARHFSDVNGTGYEDEWSILKDKYLK